MHMASAIPKQHLASGNAVYVITQVPVRTENDLRVFRKTFDDLARIGRSHHYIRHGLYSSSRIYIRNNYMTGMLLYKFCKIGSRTAICQRATGIQVGNQHFLVRAQYLRRFPHKMDTAENNDIGGRLGCLLRQRQTVSHKICYILNVTCLIIVSKNNGVLFFTHPVYLFLQVQTLWNGCVHISDRLVCQHSYLY